jgi:hypothetical protein
MAEQWIEALEAGIDIIPNPLKGPLLPRNGAVQPVDP